MKTRRESPSTSKHAGLDVAGVRLTQTGAFDPLRSARILLGACLEQDPGAFTWLGRDRYFIDLLAGSDTLRRTVTGELSGADFDAWLASGDALEAQRVTLYPASQP